MRTITRMLLTATAIALSTGAGAFASEAEPVRNPNTLRNPVQIVVGACESQEIFYVESGSALAPVTAFASAPITYAAGIAVLQGMGESAQQVIVPIAQAPHTRFGSLPVAPRRG